MSGSRGGDAPGQLLRRCVVPSVHALVNRIALLRWVAFATGGDVEVPDEGVLLIVDLDAGRRQGAMDHPALVGEGQRRPEVGGDASHRMGIERTGGFEIGQVASAERRSHQICRAGLAPEVVDGHDVWMFESGHQLGVGLESTDERGVVGLLGPAHDHRHLTTDRGLVGPVNPAQATLAERLTQLIAPNGERGLRTRR